MFYQRKEQYMKKYLRCLWMVLALLLVLCGAALADALEDPVNALGEADSFDAQLAILDSIAIKNAEELEYGGWNNRYTVNAAPGIPEGLIPEDWSKLVFAKTDGLPETMRRRKFIAVFCPSGNSAPMLAGDMLVRFPTDMRAGSLEEAEYALIVRCSFVQSGYTYTPPALSSHCDYNAYAIDLKTGETTRFWTHRNHAKKSGVRGQLDGVEFTHKELWINLRPKLFGELRHTLADGTVLLFGVAGENCYLRGIEGEATALNVPARVEGHLVTEFAEMCFADNATLKTVILPEGLRHISSKAFWCCSALESIELPNTIKTFGWAAFRGCHRLTRVVIADGTEVLPYEAFSDCEVLACCYLPESLSDGLQNARITRQAVIYAPEGSYAMEWAAQNAYKSVICDTPADMPNVQYITEGDFEFRIFGGEALLLGYQGKGMSVTVPETAGGVPVTHIMSGAFTVSDNFESIMLPRSIKTVAVYAIQLDGGKPLHLYVPGMETGFYIMSVQNFGNTITIHAPEGSLAQRYVSDEKTDQLIFEAWSEGAD